MKARIIRIVLVLSCVLSSANAGATTCVSNKKFKIRQVCGRVTDPSNVPIPMVNVELLDTHSVALQQVPTDEDGIFTLQNVAKGEYAIQIRFAGVATGWQPFIVTQHRSSAGCKKPMLVGLEPAGRCSSVSKPK